MKAESGNWKVENRNWKLVVAVNNNAVKRIRDFKDLVVWQVARLLNGYLRSTLAMKQRAA